MPKSLPEKAELKKVVREVLLEILAEDHELLRETITEAFEDMRLGELMEQERNSPPVPRAAIMKILKGEE